MTDNSFRGCAHSLENLNRYWHIRKGPVSKTIEMHIARCKSCQSKLIQIKILLKCFGIEEGDSIPENTRREIVALHEKISRELTGGCSAKFQNPITAHLSMERIYEDKFHKKRPDEKLDAHLADCRLCQRKSLVVLWLLEKQGRMRMTFRAAMKSIIPMLEVISSDTVFDHFKGRAECTIRYRSFASF